GRLRLLADADALLRELARDQMVVAYDVEGAQPAHHREQLGRLTEPLAERVGLAVVPFHLGRGIAAVRGEAQPEGHPEPALRAVPTGVRTQPRDQLERP